MNSTELEKAAATIAMSPRVARDEVSETGIDRLGWRCLEPAEQEALFVGLRTRYPTRVAVPVARRDDCDDVLVVVSSDPELVPGCAVVVHDFASPGWEVAEIFASLRDWLSSLRGPSRSPS